MRPLCTCGERPAAINYRKHGKLYYRKLCNTCLRKGEGYGIPMWKQRGYQQKDFCEKCKFTSTHSEQFNVFHIDGDLTNCRPNNLKTICANCQRVTQREGVKWKRGDLRPDF
jgi:hypothetical protein